MSDSAVVGNYAIEGLAESVWAHASALAAGEPVTPRHLAQFDELHMGGRFATARVVEALGAGPGATVLDVGSGLGGPARTVAANTGARVIGVDLTPQHVAAATDLSARVGLAGATHFVHGDATGLPLEDASCDAAMMLFVGMNVEDKLGLVTEVRRVLRPASRFVLYDPMRSGDAQPTFPVPWAASEENSFLGTLQQYRDVLDAAGFVLESEEHLGYAVKQLADAQHAGAVPGQLQMMIERQGDEGRRRLQNLAEAISAGVVEPRLLVARAR